MVSQASPAGWRSIFMLEPRGAASLAQGIEGGAMDYILFHRQTNKFLPPHGLIVAEVWQASRQPGIMPTVIRRTVFDEMPPRIQNCGGTIHHCRRRGARVRI